MAEWSAPAHSIEKLGPNVGAHAKDEDLSDGHALDEVTRASHFRHYFWEDHLVASEKRIGSA